MSAERARLALIQAEAATDPRDKAAWKAAARAWEQLSLPGPGFSLKPMQRDLTQLKRDVAEARGPFHAPEAPAIRDVRYLKPEEEETDYDIAPPVRSIAF